MPSLRARSLSELITIVRATTATYVTAAGVLATAAVNTVRIDYDPLTRARRGLLVEEARTNLALRSEEFDNAAWAKTGVTCAGAAINARAAPTGAVTMDKLEEDTSSGAHQVLQTFAKTSSSEVQAYALSCWAVASERSWIRLVAQGNTGAANSAYAEFDLSTGTAGTPVVAGSYDSGLAWIESWGGGLYRCVLVFQINNDGQTNLVFGPQLLQVGAGTVSYTGVAGSGAYVWGAQLEKGPFQTSYIPTTTAAVARNADAIEMTSLSPWLPAAGVGTIVAEYSLPWTHGALDTVARRLIEISDGSSNNRHIVYVNNGKASAASAAGGVTVAGGTGTQDQPARNVTGRTAWAWSVNDFARAVDGNVVLTDTAGTPAASLTDAYLGSGGSAQFACGHLRRFRFYPRCASNAELQQLTRAA